MPDTRHQRLIILSLCLAFCGCAEGPLWRLGQMSPWTQQKWVQEEQIADTLFARKKEMNNLVATARGQSSQQQNAAAEKLAEVALRDPILLVRLQAVRNLGELNCPAAQKALRQASMDPDADVRLTVVEAWRKMPAEHALPQLQEILGSDTNVDVRLAATRALGDFPGSPSIAALRMALSDPDPAIRMRATQSMARASGESFGSDVRAWQQYAKQITGASDERMAESPNLAAPPKR